MKRKAGMFSFLECDVEARVSECVRLCSTGIRTSGRGLLFLEGKMGAELGKRREVHQAPAFIGISSVACTARLSGERLCGTRRAWRDALSGGRPSCAPPRSAFRGQTHGSQLQLLVV